MFSLIRLAILLLSRRWGLIVVGAVCIIGGIFYGLLSHDVSYQRVGPTQVIHYLRVSDSSDAYVQLSNSPTLYIIHQNDFSPSLNNISFTDQSMVSIVYQTDTTTHIDVSSTSGAVLDGDAYTIIQMTDSDGNAVYTTSTYNQNPTGYYQNNWGAGIALFLLGAIIAGLAGFWPMIRARRSKGVATNMVAGTYMGYQNQPVQNYPNYNQNPQYPAQPLQPASPSDPYATPYAGPTVYPPVANSQYPQYPQYPQSPQYQQYPQYPPLQPSQPQNPYSQHGQANNPYPPYQQPQE